MGEIRSTLDIIMEKTKGLTMTDKEKEAFKRKEAEGKARGLLRKYLDGIMNLDRFKKEFENLGAKHIEIARRAIQKECLDGIDPEIDNTLYLDLLADVVGMDMEPFFKIMSEFNENLEKKRGKEEKRFLKRLKKAGISGSAVIPNIKADQEWIDYASRLKGSFREKMARLVGLDS